MGSDGDVSGLLEGPILPPGCKRRRTKAAGHHSDELSEAWKHLEQVVANVQQEMQSRLSAVQRREEAVSAREAACVSRECQLPAQAASQPDCLPSNGLLAAQTAGQQQPAQQLLNYPGQAAGSPRNGRDCTIASPMAGSFASGGMLHALAAQLPSAEAMSERLRSSGDQAFSQLSIHSAMSHATRLGGSIEGPDSPRSNLRFEALSASDPRHPSLCPQLPPGRPTPGHQSRSDSPELATLLAAGQPSNPFAAGNMYHAAAAPAMWQPPLAKPPLSPFVHQEAPAAADPKHSGTPLLSQLSESARFSSSDVTAEAPSAFRAPIGSADRIPSHGSACCGPNRLAEAAAAASDLRAMVRLHSNPGSGNNPHSRAEHSQADQRQAQQPGLRIMLGGSSTQLAGAAVGGGGGGGERGGSSPRAGSPRRSDSKLYSCGSRSPPDISMPPPVQHKGLESSKRPSLQNLAVLAAADTADALLPAAKQPSPAGVDCSRTCSPSDTTAPASLAVKPEPPAEDGVAAGSRKDQGKQEDGDGLPLALSKTLDYKSCDHILCLTKDMARQLLPPAPPSCASTGSSCQMQVEVTDPAGRVWPMTYRSVPARYSYEFRAGWKALAAAWRISPGDAVTLLRHTADRYRLHLQIHRGNGGASPAGAATPKGGRGRKGASSKAVKRFGSPAAGTRGGSGAASAAAAATAGGGSRKPPAMAPLLAAVQQAAVAEHMDT